MVPGQARQLPPVDAYPPPSFQPPRAPAPTIRDPEPIPEPTSWRRPEVKPELRREPAMAPDSQPAPLVPPPQDDDGTAADGALQRFGRARADQAVVPDPDEGRRPVAIAPPQSAFPEHRFGPVPTTETQALFTHSACPALTVTDVLPSTVAAAGPRSTMTIGE